MATFQLYFVNETEDTDTFDFNTLAELEQFCKEKDDTVKCHHSFLFNGKTVLHCDDFHRSEYLDAIAKVVDALN